ncbi:MAG TPA: GlxA family transcriptional regulator [Polyangia bacterium]|nr:GlxA family transcriptional regulator [Polyangia bacterium]
MKRSSTNAGPLRVALVAYPQAQALDLSGPLEVFATATQAVREGARRHAGYVVTVVGTEAGPMASSAGLRFLPDVTWRALRGPVDTLLVVGGAGARQTMNDEALLAWLRRMAPRVRRLGSVCTGAFILANAGLLDGRRVTTHWRRAAELAQRFPRLRVEPDRIWVRDGDIVTSAGITAGMDMALSLVEEDLGAEIALAVARSLVLYLRRPGDQNQFSAPLRLQAAQTPSVRDLVAWATEHPDADLSVPALARRLGRSARQLSRVFRAEVGVAPAAAVEQLRVESARRLLVESQRGVEEIASRVGFASAEVMRRTFLRRLHVSPSAYRARFAARGQAVAS